MTTKPNNLTLAKESISIQISALEELRDSLGASFESAVQAILKTTGKLVVSGIGKSGIVARKIAASFSSIGLPAVFMNSAEAAHGDLGMIKPSDTVFMISVGGNSSELVGIINRCKEVAVPVLAIVGNAQSFLHREASVALLLPSFSEVTLKVPSTSFTLTSVLGDALLACVAKEMAVSLEQYKKYHPGGKIGLALAQVKDLMRKGASLPVAKTGTPMSIALIEMSYKALGCVVVVDDAWHVIGLITDGDLRRHMSPTFTSMNVDEVMTTGPKTIEGDYPVLDALEDMNRTKITSLIVVKEGRLAGIIHIHDCLKLELDSCAS